MIVTCLLLLAFIGITVVPQLTGIRYHFLPNIAFVNGNLISLDTQRQENFDKCRKEMYIVILVGDIDPGTSLQ